MGSSVFFFGYPGKPKIAVIEIPFTVINDRSSFEIGAMLDYVRDDGSIKGVVISLNTPGGGAGPSEELYFEIARLREKKPVVVMMEDLVASGGFMMAMAANHVMAKPSSFVGDVGVILSPLPSIIPSRPSDREGVTGPFKLEGGSRRHFVTMTEQLRQAFARIVLSERGGKLRTTKNEILEGNLYTGVEAMQVGLIDSLGGQTDAIAKAASLAGVANFDLVDVNTEVSRVFNQKLERINGPVRFESGLSGGFGAAEIFALLNGATAGVSDETSTLLRDLIDGDSGSLLTLPPPGEASAPSPPMRCPTFF